MTNEIFPGEVLILRTCAADMTSYEGFLWPTSGEVSCPDWDPEPICGWGLHGLLWGEGHGFYLSTDVNARWIVAAVPADSIVILGGNVKFPRARVLYCGTREGAINYLMTNGGAGKAVVFGNVTAGDYSTATVGDYGTATAGYNGTATAGDHGSAKAGDYGTATAGYLGTATAGSHGTATAGNEGTATAGNFGTAKAGNFGTAKAGNFGTAKAGNFGTATAGDGGTVMAGENGVVALHYWDKKAEDWRLQIGRVGEDGLLPNTPYRVEDGKLVAVKTERDTRIERRT